jgi:two-component system sensor histidine kinase PilS (NtrC family)
MPALERNLRWYIAVRVVAVISVLLPFFLVVLARPDSFPAEAAHYIRLLAGTTFAATLVYIGLLGLLRRHLVVHAYIQFTGDLLLITVMVYYLGGVASPFSLLYLVIIAVASTLLRRRAGVTVATCAFLLYAALALSLSAGWLPPLDELTEVVSGWRVAYNLAIHFLGFYAMALLTSFLAHNATRAERELEVKSEHLADLQVVHRDVIQSISSGLITTDLGGVITSINQAGLAILRQHDERLIGAPVTESGLLSAAQWNDMTAVSETQGKLRVEVHLPYDGDSVYVGFSISRLNDAFGSHRGYIVIFQDLTGWRRMQDELRMKDRMAAVGELAAGLAHEIGNPLAAISGSVQMLSSALPDDASQRRLIDILLKESQRLDRTIKGFLRFARPRESASVPFDVARLLSENMELLANSEEVSVRHRLKLDLEPPSARLIADPDQVSQIFWNLARNALRAMPDGGTFRLVGRLDGDAYRLQVIDTGRGMSAAQRANLFHPFQSFFDGGTGIGMAIVYRIVEDHGGRLRVDTAPGGGTTITVELPAAGPAAPLARPPELAGAAAPHDAQAQASETQTPLPPQGAAAALSAPDAPTSQPVHPALPAGIAG